MDVLTTRKVHIKEIEKGSIFYIGDDAYIRTDNWNKFNCVSLRTGDIEKINDDMVVQELILEEKKGKQSAVKLSFKKR